MELNSFVERLRLELATAAEASGEDARVLAERLMAPLDSAVRLTLLEALSTAANEITRDLAPGSVDVRLRGRDPEFVVTPAPAEAAFEAPEIDDLPAPDDGARAGSSPTDEGPAARINFRPPEHLKARIEEAAGRERLSVNAWLVRATTRTLDLDEPRRSQAGRRGPLGGHYTGWVR
ncbi:histidine kinase [Actinoalloteichus hymeniacidonis]|uniref:HicB family protein n=1 Tax=Actinoalloteichus hymeniacidonis TaxID=340345 RepID=A0AAC9HRJ6_9PSEU|nr:histidine kinase [Actinoalloteichus hymeniacidonis]AOS64113.1 hypothetical protein TL08_16565 [Actinoalloteichus hymeniacidonis]MBB5907823.1 hypothetical protein [Actinoalloteichus hymeniacidonis]